MTKLFKKEQGFTLIELLVVIAIIGLLSTLAVVGLNNARLKARDAKRQSDIRVVQTAIELYLTENATEPNVPANWGALITDLSEQLHGGNPQDPGVNRWCYCSDDTPSSTKYLVAVALEENKEVAGDLDATADDIDDTYTFGASGDCMCSDDGEPVSISCEDSEGGTVDDQTSVTVMCLGAI